MKKLQGQREKRTVLVPGKPVQAQISAEGHIQAVFKAEGGEAGYISFNSEAYNLSKAEQAKLQEILQTGTLPSYREGSENGTYQALAVNATSEGAITFLVGDDNVVLLPVRLQIDSSVVLSAIPVFEAEAGGDFNGGDDDLDDDADEDASEDEEIEDDASL